MSDESQANARSSAKLGVILCDLDSYEVDELQCLTDDAPGISDNPVGFFENPRSWPGIPVAYAVARGARVEPLVAGDPAALAGFWDARERLADCSLVITDCGFFQYARREGRPLGTTITSGLDLLSTAGMLTDAPIGVLTVSEPLARRLLEDHDLADRLEILGLQDQPGWDGILTNDHGYKNGWDLDLLRSGVVAVLERETAEGGRFAGIGALVLECTLLPGFRREIAALTPVPILDIASFAIGALAGER
ncbi:hypothetical protein JD292_08180 [Leucobacter sp. CSA2]|uniref:Hydantoin racemase n=1 Tax=Leucobacter edaphi TaxID=2796472 RepID=A0A934QE09_9MICO|nr:hypothetical protein [Leucobacter edaphi]MBK0422050.1 hypothetical protein [Leucobacter edaphi]